MIKRICPTKRICPLLCDAFASYVECMGERCAWCKDTQFGKVCAISGEKVEVDDA